MKCTSTLRLVWGGRWYISQCGRRARWMVNGHPCCGTHAKKKNVFVLNYGRVPIEKEGATTGE